LPRLEWGASSNLLVAFHLVPGAGGSSAGR
jgi:hypothetical protein